MRLKKFMAGALCAAMFISGSGIGNLTSYAEEDIIELEETLITVGTYMDEAVPLEYGVELSYQFDKVIAQRKAYNIDASQDAILSIKGKAYSDEDDDFFAYLYNSDGEEFFGS